MQSHARSVGLPGAAKSERERDKACIQTRSLALRDKTKAVRDIYVTHAVSALSSLHMVFIYVLWGSPSKFGARSSLSMEGNQPFCQPGPKHIHNIVLQALASSAGQNCAASCRAHLAQTQQTSLLLTGEVMLQES